MEKWETNCGPALPLHQCRKKLTRHLKLRASHQSTFTASAPQKGHPLLLGARTLVGAPGIATGSKDATRSSWPYYYNQQADEWRFNSCCSCRASLTVRQKNTRTSGLVPLAICSLTKNVQLCDFSVTILAMTKSASRMRIHAHIEHRCNGPSVWALSLRAWIPRLGRKKQSSQGFYHGIGRFNIP